MFEARLRIPIRYIPITKSRLAKPLNTFATGAICVWAVNMLICMRYVLIYTLGLLVGNHHRAAYVLYCMFFTLLAAAHKTYHAVRRFVAVGYSFGWRIRTSTHNTHTYADWNTIFPYTICTGKTHRCIMYTHVHSTRQFFMGSVCFCVCVCSAGLCVLYPEGCALQPLCV